MKILVLGDTHGKTLWKEIINKENPNLIIFLGDYVTTHHDETPEEQIHNLLSILRYKEARPESVILLRGNHDMQMLGYYWAECSGFDSKLYELMTGIKDQFLERTQWLYAYQFGDKFFVFSHAGVSNTWFENVKNITNVSCIVDINNLEPSELFGFTPDSPWDCYGESVTQPCTWIRPGSLITDMPEGIIQVVGHTPVKNQCVNLTTEFRARKVEGSKGYQKFASVPDLWLCDAIDNKSYLIIEDGEPVSKVL